MLKHREMKEIVYKNYNASIKDLDVKSGRITGYFSEFGSMDYDSDIMEQGCFRKTIAERGPNGKNEIKFLWQHDSWKPLGPIEVLQEDMKGLYFEAKVTDTSYGLDALKLYRDGVINQHSVGFQTMKSIDETIDGKEVRRITEVKLWEGSAVTWGANPNTPFSGFKSLTREEKDSRIKLLMKTIREGNYTDETYSAIEYEILKLSSVNIEAVVNTSNDVNPKEAINTINKFREILNGQK